MDNTKTFLRLLGPSQSQILVGFALGFTLMAALIYTMFYSSPEVQQYFDYQSQNPSELYSNYREANESVNSSKFAADASVFTFWSTVGLLMYALVAGLGKVFQGFREFESELEDSRMNRRLLVRDALLKLLIRIGGVWALFSSIYATSKFIIPYMLISLQNVKTTPVIFGVYLLGVLCGTIVLVHVFTIALRLVRLQTRLF